jgi:hypothetical protein
MIGHLLMHSRWAKSQHHTSATKQLVKDTSFFTTVDEESEDIA